MEILLSPSFVANVFIKAFLITFYGCRGLAPSFILGNKGPHGCSTVCVCVSPHWGGQENGRKKAKIMGWDKDSLTEQRRKRTVTTTILKRRIYKKNRKHRATLSPPDAQCAPEPRLACPWLAPPTQHQA